MAECWTGEQGQKFSVSESVAIVTEVVEILKPSAIDCDLDRFKEKLHHDFTLIYAEQPHTGVPIYHFDIKDDAQMMDLLIKSNYYTTNDMQTPLIWQDGPWASGQYDLIDQTEGDGARIVLNDGENRLSPLLRYTNLPFDDESIKKGETDLRTQIGEFATDKVSFEDLYKRLVTDTMSLADFAALSVIRSLRGERAPLLLGSATIAELGRKQFNQQSLVTTVKTGNYGRYSIGRDDGQRNSLSGLVQTIGVRD